MMGDGDGDNISMISEADSQMSVNTAAAATRLHTVQDFCMSWQTCTRPKVFLFSYWLFGPAFI